MFSLKFGKWQAYSGSPAQMFHSFILKAGLQGAATRCLGEFTPSPQSTDYSRELGPVNLVLHHFKRASARCHDNHDDVRVLIRRGQASGDYP